MTQEQIDACNLSTLEARKVLRIGDRVGCTKCPGTRRVFTFDHWDGCWMVSKSGINDYHANAIYSINGEKPKFKTRYT